MAKALMGHLPSDLRTPHHLALDNAKLRARVAELNDLVGSLKAENDVLVARVAELVDATLSEMQPA
jgi:cell division protein FtsB